MIKMNWVLKENLDELTQQTSSHRKQELKHYHSFCGSVSSLFYSYLSKTRIIKVNTYTFMHILLLKVIIEMHFFFLLKKTDVHCNMNYSFKMIVLFMQHDDQGESFYSLQDFLFNKCWMQVVYSIKHIEKKCAVIWIWKIDIYVLCK